MSRFVAPAVALLALAFASSASAQPPEDGVPVRSVSEVSTLEQVGIALSHAFVPGSRVIAPLYAYPNDIACGRTTVGHMLDRYEGPAAIIYKVYPDTSVAHYYPTAEDAIEAVQNMCDSRDWHFATTRPLPHPIDHWEVDRFISRDLSRVEAQLRDRQ